MKLIFENWKRYLKEGVIPVDFTGKKGTSDPEGPVGELPVGRLPLPGTPNPIQFDFDGLVNELEEIIGRRLEDIHGQFPTDIAVEKYEQLGHIKEVVTNKLKEELFKLFYPEHEDKLEEPEGESP
tara:strand:- start:90 stop:464 length:375 start_codon:yes stop_codon:yes gene_type:complete